MITLDRRAKAAQATLDRFKDKPFKFGKNDCARMTVFHLRALGRPVKVAKAGTYHSLLGAKKALKRLGYDSIAHMADAHFNRIPPAAALVGDLVQLPSEDDALGAMTIALGNGRMLGYHQDALGAVVLQPKEYLAAWRID